MRLRGCQRVIWAKSTRARSTAAKLGGACGIALALLLAVPAPSTAQTAEPEVAPVAIDPFAPGVVINFREHMRNFVQSISTYARSINPQFIVIARDGASLVGKPDPEDNTIIFPARAYMRSIDGVMESRLLDETITTPDGKPDPVLAAIVKRRAADLTTAQATGLDVFALEFASEPQKVAPLYDAMAKKGMIPFVAESPELAAIPTTPATAYKANSKPISSTAEVMNYLFVTNSQRFGTTGNFLQAIRNTNHDMIVIDVFHGRKPLTRQDVAWLKYKKLGAPRLVLAQIDISSATSFDYFWQAGWGKGNPPFVLTPVREDPDRFRTIYWDPAWMTIISGDFNSYVYGLIDLGFDGVVLKGVDAWRFFESGGEQG